jgi:hypothetical protein
MNSELIQLVKNLIQDLLSPQKTSVRIVTTWAEDGGECLGLCCGLFRPEKREPPTHWVGD